VAPEYGQLLPCSFLFCVHKLTVFYQIMQEIDGMMWLFTERTSLRRWFPNKVAFMTCLFSNQITNSYNEYKKDKKKFKVGGLLQQYGIGELPAHGRTRLMWDLDVNRILMWFK